jgi:RNA-directed DNA polymerase
MSNATFWIADGFEFLEYKIKRGKRPLSLPTNKIRSGVRSGDLYAIPKEKSIQRFMDQVRHRTKRRVPLDTEALIKGINPLIRGWGNYFKRAHVRKRFNRLDRWIVRRIWSHKFKRWRCAGWKSLPESKLYGEFGLVNLVRLIPSIASRKTSPSWKLHAGKPHVQFERRTGASVSARLLRPDIGLGLG